MHMPTASTARTPNPAILANRRATSLASAGHYPALNSATAGVWATDHLLDSGDASLRAAPDGAGRAAGPCRPGAHVGSAGGAPCGDLVRVALVLRDGRIAQATLRRGRLRGRDRGRQRGRVARRGPRRAGGGARRRDGRLRRAGRPVAGEVPRRRPRRGRAAPRARRGLRRERRRRWRRRAPGRVLVGDERRRGQRGGRAARAPRGRARSSP